MRRPGSHRILVRDLLNAIEKFAPASLAESWDNVGLLIGDETAPVRAVLSALEITSEVMTEARKLGANAIVAHHPLIFQPLRSLNESDPLQRLIRAAVAGRISIIAAHTNLDNVRGGLNDQLAAMLGLHPEDGDSLKPLIAKTSLLSAQAKIVTYVPSESWERVRDAMAGAGAGIIGNYSHCSFRVRGTGTFQPREGAHPMIGQIGAREEVDEFRLEMVAGTDDLSRVVQAMRAAHPYEEVAFDVYPLLDPGRESASGAGTGRVGVLKRPVRLTTFADRVRNAVRPRHLRVVGQGRRMVRRVAVCTGAGAAFIELAHRAGADVYVTGDVKHHEAALAVELGLAVIDPGHATSESHAAALLREIISSALPGLKVIASKVPVEPFE